MKGTISNEQALKASKCLNFVISYPDWIYEWYKGKWAIGRKVLHKNDKNNLKSDFLSIN